MFEGFEIRDVETSETRIHLRDRRLGTAAPAAPRLSAEPRHVAPGGTRAGRTLHASSARICAATATAASRPPTRSMPSTASAAARSDMVEVMAALGHQRFGLAGHDRGGRVGHRLALDHPDRVERLAVLDIVPTRTIFRATNQAIATGYYPLVLPDPAARATRAPDRRRPDVLPALGARRAGGRGLDAFAPEALAEYERCFKDPAMIHASCEDYRAAASIDLAHDEADLERRIQCPVLALWGRRGLMERHFDVLATWRERSAGPVSGRALDCGHFLAEERPEETAEALRAFFGG